MSAQYVLSYQIIITRWSIFLEQSVCGLSPCLGMQDKPVILYPDKFLTSKTRTNFQWERSNDKLFLHSFILDYYLYQDKFLTSKTRTNFPQERRHGQKGTFSLLVLIILGKFLTRKTRKNCPQERSIDKQGNALCKALVLSFIYTRISFSLAKTRTNCQYEQRQIGDFFGKPLFLTFISTRMSFLL